METLENSLSHLIDQMMYITRHQEYQRVNKHFTVCRHNNRMMWQYMWVHRTTESSEEKVGYAVAWNESYHMPSLLALKKDVRFHVSLMFYIPYSFRRKRRCFVRSVRTPTVKFYGGPWCRPLFCFRSVSGRWNDSKTSSSPRSWSDDDPWPVRSTQWPYSMSWPYLSQCLYCSLQQVYFMSVSLQK